MMEQGGDEIGFFLETYEVRRGRPVGGLQTGRAEPVMAGTGSRAGRDGIMLTSISLMLFGTCVAVDGDSVYDITMYPFSWC